LESQRTLSRSAKKAQFLSQIDSLLEAKMTSKSSTKKLFDEEVEGDLAHESDLDLSLDLGDEPQEYEEAKEFY